MKNFDLRPDYDPNLLPQWQAPSETETGFVRLVKRLYKEQMASLLFGSEHIIAGETTDPIDLTKTSDDLLSGHLERDRYEFDFCHEDNIDDFASMKKKPRRTDRIN